MCIDHVHRHCSKRRLECWAVSILVEGAFESRVHPSRGSIRVEGASESREHSSQGAGSDDEVMILLFFWTVGKVTLESLKHAPFWPPRYARRNFRHSLVWTPDPSCAARRVFAWHFSMKTVYSLIQDQTL